MAKAKLAAVTQQWVEGKTEKQQDVKTSKQQDSKTVDIVKQTIYISRKANKLLWYNRVDTGKTISAAIDELVTKHLARN
jgi:hypothetical protein